MKIILFQFYSSYPCPDYDEMGRYFRHRGHDVCITHMSEDKKLQLYFNNHDKELDIFPNKLKNQKHFGFLSRRIAFVIFMFRIRKLIKEQMPDIFMIATSELMYLSLLPVLINKKVKFILDIRQIGFSPGKSLRSKYRNLKLKMNYFFLSKFIYDHTCYAFKDAAEIILGKNWAKQKASIKEVGVNKLFLETPRMNLSWKDEKLKMVYIGSLSKIRNLEFIIDSVLEIAQFSKNFHITFIGHDSDNHYHRYIEKKNLQEYITILDRINYHDIPSVLNHYHLAIAYVPEHPDWHYQPTLKVKEYCALGMPIIATDNKPNRNFVIENETGIFFSNKQADFCQSVLCILNNKSLYSLISKNSLKRRYGITWEDSAISYEKLFNKLVGTV